MQDDFTPVPAMRVRLSLLKALFYGLLSGMTVYGGFRTASNYRAGAIGIGRGFGAFGSLGIDDTLAKAIYPAAKRDRAGVAHSVSERFQRYRHRLQPASYRYASRNYYEFSELNQSDSQQLQLNNRRSRSQVTFSQTLGQFGSLSVSAWMQDYWHTSGQDKTIHIGWYTSWRGISGARDMITPTQRVSSIPIAPCRLTSMFRLATGYRTARSVTSSTTTIVE